MSEKNNSTADRELVITRLLNSPRELVWKVWTEPQHITQWWGPTGFTNTIHEMNVKPGGVWRFMMHGLNGMDFPNKIVFNEVVKPERLVYTHSSEDENDLNSFKTTVTFEEQNGKTHLTMTAVFAAAEERNRVVKEFGAAEGGIQTINKLEAYLAKM
ncbi:MAG: SRPBCC family protein [Bacteroidia bacterium]|nr:SRPBCC family protein [Bacteroidia bacterium]